MPGATTVALRAAVHFGSPCLDVSIARLLDDSPRKCSDLLKGDNVLEQKGVQRAVVQGIEGIRVPSCLDCPPRPLRLLGKHGHGVVGHRDLAPAAPPALPRGTCSCTSLRKPASRSPASAPDSM